MPKFTFDCRKSVYVIFVGEEAADEGGQRCEFFTLALQAMADDHTIFQGPANRCSFLHNAQALGARKFFYAGMLVAFSLGNGGPGFPCSAKSVFHYLCYGLGPRVQPEVDDVPEFEIKEKLEKVSSMLYSRCSDATGIHILSYIIFTRSFPSWWITMSSNDSELRSILLEDEFGFIRECGFIKPSRRLHKMTYLQ